MRRRFEKNSSFCFQVKRDKISRMESKFSFVKVLL